MNEDRPVDQVLDLLVYAPIGFALEARELLPQLVDRGRGQVALMRLAGRMASQQTPDGDVTDTLRQGIGIVIDLEDCDGAAVLFTITADDSITVFVNIRHNRCVGACLIFAGDEACFDTLLAATGKSNCCGISDGT